MAETAYARLTPAELLEIMQVALGGSGPQGANRDKLLQLGIVQGAKRVWYHSAWRWRVLPYDLTTTADQAYTTLPANCREARIIRDVWYSDQPTMGCRYVKAALWDRQLRLSQVANGATGTGRPDYFTVRLRTVDSADIFVVEWTPTPDDAYTIKGFEYLKTMPSIDFAGTANIFPEGEFDILWQAAAFRSVLTSGFRVGNMTDGQRMMGLNEYNELMGQAEDRWAIEDAYSIDTALPDVDGVLGEALGASDAMETCGEWPD